MTERKHDLTDEDIAELVARARKYPCRVFDEAEIAALPSRQPKDPDAGLGAQPWATTAHGLQTADGIFLADFRRHKSGHDPSAVRRAILAAPKAIKLARHIIAASKAESLNPRMWPDAVALAAEVLAIVDGKEERS